jgi:hypothetical protein
VTRPVRSGGPRSRPAQKAVARDRHDGRVIDSVPKFWRQQGAIATHERTLAALDAITELIDRSRRARTVAEHIEVQREIGGVALEIRDFHDRMRLRKQELRRELTEAKARGDMARVREISATLPGLDLALRANRRCWGALRSVQDGVIWRALSFDRHRIGMLGYGESVHWPSTSFESELVAAEVHWEAGRLALLCDLSSCVNTGDLMVFDGAGEIRLIEVKEDEDASEETPQFDRMRRKVEFLNTGYSESLSPYPLHRPRRRPRLRTNLSTLGDALRFAAQHGFCVRLAGGFAQLNVLDMLGIDATAPEDQMERLDRMQRGFQARMGPAWRGAETYAWDSMTRVDRDETHAVTTTAPFSIFPFPPDVCARLILGLAGYRTIVNLSLLWAALRRNGWEKAPIPDELAGKCFLAARRGPLLMVPPDNLMEQLVTELLTPAAFAASLDATAEIKVGTQGAVNVGWGWEDEGRVWW